MSIYLQLALILAATFAISFAFLQMGFLPLSLVGLVLGGIAMYRVMKASQGDSAL